MRIVLVIFALAAVACGGDQGSNSGPVPQPLFSDIQEKIFSPSCAAFSSCHSTVGQAAHCVLTPDRSYATLVGHVATMNPAKTLVVPGHPEESFLIEKLRGELDSMEGERMPLRNPPLREEQIQAIEEWIAAGASSD